MWGPNTSLENVYLFKSVQISCINHQYTALSLVAVSTAHLEAEIKFFSKSAYFSSLIDYVLLLLSVI